MSPLREELVQALRDEIDAFRGTSNRAYDLVAEVLTRVVLKLESGSAADTESSVVVPPGGTLVLRLGTHLSTDEYQEYRAAMSDALSRYAEQTDLHVLVVVADQLGSCSEGHRVDLD